MKQIKGEKVVLRPMQKDEVEMFYKWATSSDATPFWYGRSYGTKVPTFEEFLEDWKPHYFEGRNPELGRCFVILVNSVPIGQVNYNKIDDKRRAELDIIIADSQNWGKGYGSDAVRSLVEFLFEKMDVLEVWTAAIKTNPRALAAYGKAGFEITPPPPRLGKHPHWKGRDLEKYVFLKTRKS